jgi:hypothetical protein
MIAERAAIPARQPGTSRLQRRAVWLELGLTAAAHILRNRRSREALTVGVIVLVALTHMSWRALARIVKDLITWDNARLADLENQLHRQRIARTADGAIVEGTVIPPRQAEAPGRQHNAVWLGVGLVAAARALRNRRLDEQAIAVVFALAALSQMSWKELVRAVRDLIAWDNARLADLNRQLRRDRKPRPTRLCHE